MLDITSVGIENAIREVFKINKVLNYILQHNIELARLLANHKWDSVVLDAFRVQGPDGEVARKKYAMKVKGQKDFE